MFGFFKNLSKGKNLIESFFMTMYDLTFQKNKVIEIPRVVKKVKHSA